MEDRKKRSVVKGFLFFSALVIGVVSLYTTFMIFTVPVHGQLSPDEYIKIRNETNETNKSDVGDSFVVEGKGEGFAGGEGEEFNTDTLPASEGEPPYTGLINPLVVHDVELDKPNMSRLLLLLAGLVVVVIYFVYWKVERG